MLFCELSDKIIVNFHVCPSVCSSLCLPEKIPPILLDRQFSDFTPDITPIILAAHTNNYEIIKLLVQRGVSIPQPHAVRCNCVECASSSDVDGLRHSRSRLNIYKALSSPSLIALSSEDPFLTAFQLSWELKELSAVENEFKSEYEELSHTCKQFAKDLLDQTRSSRELEIILNYRDGINPLLDENGNDLARLKLAIKYCQKEVSSLLLWYPHCQIGLQQHSTTTVFFLLDIFKVKKIPQAMMSCLDNTGAHTDAPRSGRIYSG